MDENEDEMQWRDFLNALADGEEGAERDAGGDRLAPVYFESEESDYGTDLSEIGWTDDEEEWQSEEEEEAQPRVNENAAAVGEGDGRGEEGEGGNGRDQPDDGEEAFHLAQERARDAIQEVQAELNAIGRAMIEPGQRIAIRIVEEQWEDPLQANQPNDENQVPPQEAHVRIRVNDEDWVQVHPRPANPNPMNPHHHHFWPAGFIPPGIVPPPQANQRAPMGAAPPPVPQGAHQMVFMHAGQMAFMHAVPPPVPRAPRVRPPHIPVELEDNGPVDPRQPQHPDVPHHRNVQALPRFGDPLPPVPPPRHEFHVFIGRMHNDLNEQRNGRGDGGGTLTEEMIKEAEELREEDNKSDPSPIRFSRSCPVCAIQNPKKRAAFISCGHIVCFPCAVDNAKSDGTGGKCVICRAVCGFVKIFEDEIGGENG